LFTKNETFNLTIYDLKPYTSYSVRLSACNQAGCVEASNRGLRRIKTKLQLFKNKTYFEIKTMDYHLAGFHKPIIYIINHRTVEVVWQEPEESNGNLVEYKVYRNNELAAVLNLKEDDNSTQYMFTYKLGFYIFRDTQLNSGAIYSYKIQASTEHYSLLTQAVSVQMPPTTFLIDCKRTRVNVSQSRFSENKDSTNAAGLSLFDGILKVNFTVASPTQVRIAYDFSQWKQFILCLSKSSYSNAMLNKSALDVVSVFSIKILLQSNLNGLQSLDFPYPSTDDTDLLVNKVQFMLSGLLGFSNYSIRISLSALYPNTQVLTTKAIYLRTNEQKPCCKFRQPIVIRNSFARHFAVKWSNHDFEPNGVLTRFKIYRYQLKSHGCVEFGFNWINNVSFFLESAVTTLTQIDINLASTNNSNFFYDETNQEYAYIDSDTVLQHAFSHYIYKIFAYNSFGKIESLWSEPEIAWQYMPPTPPYDLKITEAHATGFRLKFKQPSRFNGILAYYLIKLVPFVQKTAEKVGKEVLLSIRPMQSCQTFLDFSSNEVEPPLIDVHVSGLESFQSYRITVRALNQVGVSSEESEEIVGNTLESSPEYLPRIYAKSIECLNSKVCITFKFEDAARLNGQLISINLYQIKSTTLEGGKAKQGFEKNREKVKIYYDNELRVIYSGLQRDFLFTNLQPYTQYSFIYELCTFAGCTRQVEPLNIRSIETLPLNQPTPDIRRIVTTTDDMFCFQIHWAMPESPNGLVLYFEMYRIFAPFNDVNETVFDYNDPEQVRLVSTLSLK
jgi:hypothetical protein